MKIASALVLLAFVVITFEEHGLVPCPIPPPAIIKMDDGTYRRREQQFIHTVACWSVGQWQEQWTDYPENGGAFIRRITVPAGP